MQLLLRQWRFLLGLGIVPVPMTINRFRFSVEGARRKIIYNVSMASVVTSLINTPFHKIDYVDATSTTQEAIGASIVSGGQISLNAPATPDNNIRVEVVGL